MNVLLALNVQAAGVRDVASPVSAGEVGAVLLGVAILIGASYYWPKFMDWRRRKKRTREHMDIREIKLREIVADVIGDGILDRQVKGELSNQEARKVFKWLSDKLDLPDLVPASARADAVKQGLRSRKILREQNGSKPANIPGPKPGEEVPYVPVERKFRRRSNQV